MNNNEVFMIRENAFNVLVQAQNKCVADKQHEDLLLCYNFNKEHFGNWCSEEEFDKCKAYLISINAIKIVAPYIVSITGRGIDIAEDIIESAKNPNAHIRE